MAAKYYHIENKTAQTKVLKPVISTDVMGNRNVEVKAVGAWAEPAVVLSNNGAPDSVQAAQLEQEKIATVQRKKEERLKQFQEDVKKRVQQITKAKRKQQMQKESEKMLLQHHLLQKHLKALEDSTGTKNRVLVPAGPSVYLKQASAITLSDDQIQNQRRLFAAQNQQIHAYASEARQKLIGRRLADDDPASDDLPAGCRSRLEREKNWTSRTSWDSVSDDGIEGEENDLEKFRRDEQEGEQSLEKHEHDKEKAEDCGGALGADRVRCVRFDLQKNLEEDNSVKIPSRGMTRKPHRSRSATLIDLHTGITESAERARQSQQLLSYRRLCSDMERQAVRDNVQRKKQRKVAERIKREKEDWRRQEEDQARRIVEPRDPVTGETCLEASLREQLERTHVNEILQERQGQRQKQLEMTRYLEALRNNLHEKLSKKGIELPALCCCGETLWDTNPDTCANNCFFYRNHRAYARALQSLLTSTELV